MSKFLYEPTITDFVTTLECYSHLYTMQGINSYSIFTAGKGLYQIYQGEYKAGFNVAFETFSSMAFSYVITGTDNL